MNEGVKPFHILVVLVVAAGAFAGGVVILRKEPPAPRQEAAVQQLAALSVKDEAEDKPAAEPAQPEPPAAPPAVKTAPVAPKATPAPAAPVHKEWVSTIWGLPEPRKLTSKEKAALALLGTVEDTAGFKFSTVRLEDGSSIPGVPPPESEEVTRRVVAKVKALGLPDGFEAVVQELSFHNLNHLIVPVTKPAEWATLATILGQPDAEAGHSDVYVRGPGRSRTYYGVTWQRYGWLEFGVAEGKVRALRAELRHADIVPAESIPGGRTPPDPVKAAEYKKKLPRRGDEAEALRLLGQAADVRVTERKLVKADPNFPALAREANGLVGKDLHPHLLEAARKLRQSRQAEHLVVTPSRPCTVDQMLELMGPGNVRSSDTTTIPGQTLTWYRFGAVEFGGVGAQVKKVRVLCALVSAAKK